MPCQLYWVAVCCERQTAVQHWGGVEALRRGCQDTSPQGQVQGVRTGPHRPLPGGPLRSASGPHTIPNWARPSLQRLGPSAVDPDRPDVSILDVIWAPPYPGIHKVKHSPGLLRA